MVERFLGPKKARDIALVLKFNGSLFIAGAVVFLYLLIAGPERMRVEGVPEVLVAILGILFFFVSGVMCWYFAVRDHREDDR